MLQLSSGPLGRVSYLFAYMNISKFFICFIFSMFFIAGCSQVQYFTRVQGYDLNATWRADTIPPGYVSYTFKDSLLTYLLRVGAEPHDNFYDAFFVLFGPPLLPVIPNPFAIFSSDRIYVYIEVQSNPTSIPLDLRSVYLMCDDTLRISPSEIYVILPKASTPQRYLTQGAVSLSYKVPAGGIQTFHVVFASALPKKIPIQIPSLTYEWWSKYRWVFFMLLLN